MFLDVGSRRKPIRRSWSRCGADPLVEGLVTDPESLL
jgi:hypothetical protein